MKGAGRDHLGIGNVVLLLVSALIAWDSLRRLNDFLERRDLIYRNWGSPTVRLLTVLVAVVTIVWVVRRAHRPWAWGVAALTLAGLGVQWFSFNPGAPDKGIFEMRDALQSWAAVSTGLALVWGAVVAVSPRQSAPDPAP